MYSMRKYLIGILFVIFILFVGRIAELQTVVGGLKDSLQKAETKANEVSHERQQLISEKTKAETYANKLQAELTGTKQKLEMVGQLEAEVEMCRADLKEAIKYKNELDTLTLSMEELHGKLETCQNDAAQMTLGGLELTAEVVRLAQEKQQLEEAASKLVNLVLFCNVVNAEATEVLIQMEEMLE